MNTGKIIDLESYFIPNKDATYVTRYGGLCLQSVDLAGNLRVLKANDQASFPPVNIEEVIKYVNVFMCTLTGMLNEEIRSISLDNLKQQIIGNCIIAKECKWKSPCFDKKRRHYTFYDPKYDEVKSEFGLDYPNDIVWLKFTKDGYLGVVADSFDINFDYDTSSGKLLKVVKKEWNNRFVLIVPITPKMKRFRSRKEIETGLGNYLVNMGVPIIDFYSHNNFIVC